MTLPITRTTGAPWLRPLLVVALALAALIAATDVLAPAARTATIIAFLAVGPGLGWIELLGIADRWRELALAIGLSLALDVLVVGTFEYVGDGQAGYPLAVLIGIAVSGAVAQIVIRRQRRRGHGRHSEEMAA